MKKQFTLHLDAVIVLVLLFTLSLGFNAVQHFQYKSLLKENFGLKMQALEDELNLHSLRQALDRQQQKADSSDPEAPAQ